MSTVFGTDIDKSAIERKYVLEKFKMFMFAIFREKG
jgi:hypothetical protein